MKFAEHLNAQLTPEWRKQYIRYEEMKTMLYTAIERAPSGEAFDPEMLIRYFTTFDEHFFHVCYKELEKINTFYSEKHAEATRKFATLCSELRETLQDAQDCAGKNDFSSAKSMSLNPRKRKNAPRKKLHELKLAFSEYYLSLVLLQNYQNLNFTGFRKILKKHDKLLQVDRGSKWHSEHVEMAHFYLNKDISRLLRETETCVTRELEGGDRGRAMKRLRVPPLGGFGGSDSSGGGATGWTTYRVGFFTGALAVLAMGVVISCVYNKATNLYNSKSSHTAYRDEENLLNFTQTISPNQTHNLDSNHSTTNKPRPKWWLIPMRLYRTPLLLIEFCFLWAANVRGWRVSGVNRVLVFELDPRCHLSEQHVTEIGAVFGVIWTLSVLCFLYSNQLGVPAFINPLILYFLMFGFLLNPFKTLRHEARFWTLKILARIFLSPMFHVNFADFWVADQINSMLPLFIDLQYFFCYYANLQSWYEPNDSKVCVEDSIALRAVMAALPAWFRFAQCCRRYRDTREANPHLANALKYSTTFLVVGFATLSASNAGTDANNSSNPWFYLWFVSAIISSSYTYIWDIKLDWGLFDFKEREHKFLREEIVYPYMWTYYFGIIEDLVLRFAWLVSLGLTESGIVSTEVMLTLITPWEVFRRFVWNYFRLENEHLNNCGKFRAVRDISLAPLDSSDQLAILRMMDHPDDAIINRHHGVHSGWKKTNSILHQHCINHHSQSSSGGSFYQRNNGNTHKRVRSIMSNARPQIRILLRGNSANENLGAR